MTPKPDIKPYWHSTDEAVNCSLTMRKIRKRICDANPDYEPKSRFQCKHRSIRTKHPRLSQRQMYNRYAER